MIPRSKSVLLGTTILIIASCLFFASAAFGEALSRTDENNKNAEALLRATARLRGFTLPSDAADEATFEELRQKWGANAVRLMLRPLWRNEDDPVEGWKKMLERLPAQMEAARKNHIFVIVAPFEPPIPGFKELRASGPNMWQRYIWQNPGMLQEIKQNAVDLAKLLDPYRDMAWIDLYNEPLDWDDMPSYPKKWPEWAQACVDAVREVSDIPLVVQVGPGGLCSGFKTFPLLKGGGIVYSPHSYLPHQYTHQGIKDIKGTDLAQAFKEVSKPWPGNYSGVLWNKEQLRASLEPVIQFAKVNGVRIYVGEFGVVRWAPGAADYLRDSMEIFEELGWDWTCHAFRESSIWSPEYGDEYKPGAPISSTPTARARVIREFLSRNK